MKCYLFLHFYYTLKNQLHADELYYVGFFLLFEKKSAISGGLHGWSKHSLLMNVPHQNHSSESNHKRSGEKKPS